jgi:hypothetical protein
MSTTPSDPNYINTKALEGLMRAFDRAISGKYSPQSAEPFNVEPQVKMVEACDSTEVIVQRHKHTPSPWERFSPLKNIIRFRDSIRLRRYNREWIKNNIDNQSHVQS